ncbi:MAG: enoyl-CoA hydratase/isomerase family protein [Kyrpidia tusciae]|nr:enoyl-CoA hydratase-related protein [Kyrpidia tusciae]MBE3552577.1 enoyl-CoA hydratase/isomerase family protein [Kyrpidia tusciae]
MEDVRYEVNQGVAVITLNRPEVLNALTDQVLASLREALIRAEQDEGVRSVLLTGAGKGFCAGLDLKSVDPGMLGRIDMHVRRDFNPLILKMQQLPKPILAAVGGVAAGAGLSLALAADLRIASEDARFVSAFIRIGLVPDSGASYFLPRLIGVSRAMELALTGESLDAEKALQAGLVNRVVPREQLEEASLAWAQQLAEGPTYAMALTKKMIYEGAAGSLAEALDREATYQGWAAGSADFTEGVQAFLEKRKARFQGR